MDQVTNSTKLFHCDVYSLKHFMCHKSSLNNFNVQFNLLYAIREPNVKKIRRKRYKSHFCTKDRRDKN
jgi:hypothetical protein